MQHITNSAQATTITPGVKSLKVWSPVFREGQAIPRRHSSQGLNVHPPLCIEQLPQRAVSLVIEMEDTSGVPGARIHWLAWNIPVASYIAENSNYGTQGVNDFGLQGYNGPCPPFAQHRYTFKVYALDTWIDLPGRATKNRLLKNMAGHIVGVGATTGVYKRYNKGSRWLL